MCLTPKHAIMTKMIVMKIIIYTGIINNDKYIAMAYVLGCTCLCKRLIPKTNESMFTTST